MERSRWLDPPALARHLSTTTNMIPRYVQQGKIPRPSLHLGPRSPRWDVHEVDAVMLKAGGIVTSETTSYMVQRACEEIERDAARRKDRAKGSRRRIS
ncbi:helix-turn-helix transcriptional regulator [Asaia lannensis]|uniref:helix-turn-helix transcriptional regulator n=1 Tax=Asaia lannensis TaxID=415421 RepID=UPI00387321D1